jgi:phage tail tape-measure protein
VNEGWKGAIAGGLAGGALGSVVPALGTLAGAAAGAYAGHKLGDEGFKDPDAEYKKAQKLKQTPPVAEGPVGSLVGGIAGAALTKTPSGAMAGSRLGSAVGDAMSGSEETDEGQHTQHGMDATPGRVDYKDEKFSDIKPMGFRQDPIQATTDRALKYSAQGVNKLRDLFREDEQAVVENQDKFSALSGQYGHSGKLQKFDDVEQDVLARLKQLSGMIRPM